MISLPNPVKVLTVENYQEVLIESVVEQIQYLVDEESMELNDIIDFINQYNTDVFMERYEEYVDCGEEFSYDAVDAFIEEFGIHTFSHDAFHDSYRGQYDSKADYAYAYVSDCYSIELPGFVEIDWEATFDNMEESFCNGFVFSNQF